MKPKTIIRVSLWLIGKESSCNAGARDDVDSIPGSGRFPGGNGNPLQYSCLETPLTEEPGGLQPTRLQRITHNWAHTGSPCSLTVIRGGVIPSQAPLHIINSCLHVPEDESNEYIFTFSFQLGESVWEEATKQISSPLIAFPFSGLICWFQRT